jgi:DNA repair exonuclease SbcCD ATPase subunit
MESAKQSAFPTVKDAQNALDRVCRTLESAGKDAQKAQTQLKERDLRIEQLVAKLETSEAECTSLKVERDALLAERTTLAKKEAAVGAAEEELRAEKEKAVEVLSRAAATMQEMADAHRRPGVSAVGAIKSDAGTVMTMPTAACVSSFLAFLIYLHAYSIIALVRRQNRPLAQSRARNVRIATRTPTCRPPFRAHARPGAC